MKRIFYILIIALISSITAFGQGVFVDQPKMLFSNEQTIGAFLSSNGIGLDYRFAKYINARNDRIYEISFDYVKDPKEYKTVISYDRYTRRFVFGKENLFWELKGQIGNQHELYSKYDFSSISIRMFYSGGLSIGFQKPVYYDIITYDNTGQPIAIEEKTFDPSIHQYNYGGNSGFTKGFSELEVIPGITGKIGVNFEYSEREPIVHALEAGIGLTLYPKNIKIMATEKTQFFFFKMFLGYRFGTLLDISDASLAKTRKERRKERQNAIEKPINIIR